MSHCSAMVAAIRFLQEAVHSCEFIGAVSSLVKKYLGRHLVPVLSLQESLWKDLTVSHTQETVVTEMQDHFHIQTSLLCCTPFSTSVEPLEGSTNPPNSPSPRQWLQRRTFSRSSTPVALCSRVKSQGGCKNIFIQSLPQTK